MAPVEMMTIQNAILLRARGSELLILEHHAQELKKRIEPKEFSKYFLSSALINRPARKLFEAWLRKDKSVWPRLYKLVQENITPPDAKTEEKDAAPVKAEKPQKKEDNPEKEKKKSKTTKAVKKAATTKKEKTAVKKAKTTAKTATKKSTTGAAKKKTTTAKKSTKTAAKTKK